MPSDVWADPQLLEGVNRRDPAALERFFDAAFPYVYSLAHHLTGHREAAEDVSQEVFLKVFRAAHRIDADRSPRAWLTTVTYNTVRDTARRRQPERMDLEEVEARAAEMTTPEDEAGRGETAVLVKRALKQLDEENRAIVVLRDFAEVSHTDIAAMMDLSHAAVRKRYSRALDRLRELIQGLES